MQLRTELHTPGRRSASLLVLLPPSLSSLDDFYQHGFIEAVRQRAIDADLLLADVSARHVMERRVVSALHTQVVLPAQAQGYQQIWLAGISMGAFCALHYAAEHAPRLAGLCLLAPYPGTGDVLAELRAAGGAAAWAQGAPEAGPLLTATPGQDSAPADERAWWRWLGRQADVNAWPTPVYLASGLSDRFHKGQQLLAELLPAARCHWLPGGHDWATWRLLWAHWLDHGPLGQAQGTRP